MKRVFLAIFVFSLALCFGLGDTHSSAGTAVTAVSPNLVISQFQPGTASVANDEFIEIHNTGPTAVDLNGYVLVYRSQDGTNDRQITGWASSVVIQPGQYHLVASNSYTGGTTPDTVYNNDACQCALSATNGGLAIRLGAANSGAIIDAVGWGTGSNIFVEGTRTTAPGSGNSKARQQQGCQDTDDNSQDFFTQTPWAPRNMATPAVTCAGGGTTLFAAINANPNAVSPGGSILFTVTVVPATTPPSTGISITGDLSPIGGEASQAFFDDGTHGDAAAGDNVFSYLASVPQGSAGGSRTITAHASDAESRTVDLVVGVTINAPLPGEDPLLLGNPSNATPDIANENNYLMQKPQYTLSYNRAKGTPNWVAWRLASSWIGSTSRQDDYRPDTSLPAGWYQVLTEDYSGSGYDRGHMCPSGDRTNSVANNSATFLMTNFVPQLSANNQGPWEEFESYCRTLAAAGNEIYIFSGPYGAQGTIANGHVTVPQYTWKVVLVLPNGSNDLLRIDKGTRAFGIIVPNFGPLDINTPWRNFRVPVNTVEYLTGYDFFTNVGKNTQELIEKRRDLQ